MHFFAPLTLIELITSWHNYLLFIELLLPRNRHKFSKCSQNPFVALLMLLLHFYLCTFSARCCRINALVCAPTSAISSFGIFNIFLLPNNFTGSFPFSLLYFLFTLYSSEKYLLRYLAPTHVHTRLVKPKGKRPAGNQRKLAKTCLIATMRLHVLLCNKLILKKPTAFEKAYGAATVGVEISEKRRHGSSLTYSKII